MHRNLPSKSPVIIFATLLLMIAFSAAFVHVADPAPDHHNAQQCSVCLWLSTLASWVPAVAVLIFVAFAFFKPALVFCVPSPSVSPARGRSPPLV